MPILLLKLTLAPLLIAAATFVQRRWGGSLGGLMVGLLLTSAPVSVFIALERGPAFAARSAIGTLLGTVAMSGFCAVYAISARRLSWLPSAMLASFTCAVVTIVMSRVPQDAVTAAAISYPALLALVLMTERPGIRLPAVPPPWCDTPARMVGGRSRRVDHGSSRIHWPDLERPARDLARIRSRDGHLFSSPWRPPGGARRLAWRFRRSIWRSDVFPHRRSTPARRRPLSCLRSGRVGRLGRRRTEPRGVFTP